EFLLATDAFVPTKKAVAGASEAPLELGGASLDFGVRPMAVEPGKVETKHAIRIFRVTEDGENPVEDQFRFTPVKKKAPSAVWGKAHTVPDHPDRILPPSPDEPRFVGGDVLTGYEISLKEPPRPGDTDDILTEKLQYDTTPVPDVFN